MDFLTAPDPGEFQRLPPVHALSLEDKRPRVRCKHGDTVVVAVRRGPERFETMAACVEKYCCNTLIALDQQRPHAPPVPIRCRPCENVYQASLARDRRRFEYGPRKSSAKDMADYAELGVATTEVFSNPDLVRLICANQIGPTTFAAVSRINRTTHGVCRTSLPLLRSVAYFTGALTTTQFRGLFALQSYEAVRLPHEDRGRYRLYSGAAIEAVLGEPNVMQRIAKALPLLGLQLVRYKTRKAEEEGYDRMPLVSQAAHLRTPEKKKMAPRGYKRSTIELEDFHRGKYLALQRQSAAYCA